MSKKNLYIISALVVIIVLSLIAAAVLYSTQAPTQQTQNSSSSEASSSAAAVPIQSDSDLESGRQTILDMQTAVAGRDYDQFSRYIDSDKLASNLLERYLQQLSATTPNYKTTVEPLLTDQVKSSMKTRLLQSIKDNINAGNSRFASLDIESVKIIGNKLEVLPAGNRQIKIYFEKQDGSWKLVDVEGDTLLQNVQLI